MEFAGKKIVAVLICSNMLFLGIPPSVLASDISGVNPTVIGGKNVYNIEGQKFSGSTQFRNYNNFNLTKGDIANLIYKNGYDKFINLVNNQVTINGIVNTMRDNNFYNGHAIFVSPNGVVIGSSGILNVGALSLITPSQSSYNTFLEKYNANTLSAYEFGADKYKSLLTASDGNITINGRILSRGDVNLYGKNIKIEGASNSHAGIISGWKDNNTVLSDFDAGKSLFDSLVSHNITDGTHYNLQDGKIIISAQSDSDAAINIKNADLLSPVSANIISTVKYSEQERRDKIKSEINIENSKISSKDVNIGAFATNEKTIAALSPDSIVFIKNMLVDIFTKDFVVTTLWGTSGGAEAKVTIKDAIIEATKDASIYADAVSKTEQNINLLTPTAILLLKDAIVGKDGSIDTTQRANAKLTEYFSSGLFSGFEGPRSSAVVTVQNSDINTGNDLNIASNANSSLTATSNLLGQVLPIGMYGVGTSTESKAIVKDSTLKSTRDTTVEAISLNKNKIVMKSDSLLSMPIEDGAFAILLNNTTKTDTEAKVTNTTIDARDLNVGAVNLSDSDVKLEMVAKVGKNVQQQGDAPNSAVSLVAILNRSQNNVTAEVNNSEVNVAGDVNVVAQSLNTTKNSASGKIQDDNVAPPETVFSGTQKKLKAFQTTYLNRSLFSRIKGKTEIEATGNSLVQAGGALVWNKTENNTNAKITNSSINASNDVNVKANTVDLTANSALAESNGKAKVGVGLGVIVNEEKNNTNAIIDNSNIDANNSDVYATTELPMNQGSITFGVKFPFKIFGVDNLQFGGKFVSEANAKWDLSFVHPLQDASFSSGVDFTGIGDQNVTSAVMDAIAPKFRLTGFFNNFSQTTSKAEGVDVSASVVYNEVVNNTLATIKNNSEITLDGDLAVNAVNSVIGYNAAGMIDILINKINYKIPGQPDYGYKPQMDSDTFGMGANVIWDIYNNNAAAKIENSEISAQNGDVSITSANEQAYITAIATGARSKSIGIDGSINVQKLNGNTDSTVSDNSVINAKNVNVNAGAAKVATSGGKIEIDETTNRAKLNDERNANDQITNIIATGAWVSQYKEIDNKIQESSEGVSIGADVNYTTIERNIKALVENSEITTTQNTLINADTYSQTLNLAVAAAFSGGVTQKNADVSKVDKGVDKAKNDNNPNDMFGNLFANEDEYMKNPVGNALAPFSLSAAGAVSVNTDTTNVESKISKSTVNAGSALDVKSNKESRIINMSGGLGKSKKVGAGAALNFYRQNGKISSKIDDSTITFTKNNAVLNVNADNTNKIVDIAIGAGVGTNTQAEAKGFRAAAGGSYTRNTITPTVEAIINNSAVSSDNASDVITAYVLANSQLIILDIAGGGAYLNGGTTGVGAGFATNYNDINTTINALVQNSNLTNIADLTVSSLARNNLTNVAVAGAMVSGTSSGYLFNGALNLDFIHNNVSSKIVNSDIHASEDVNVFATSDTDNTNVSGTLNVSSANTGFGVNGDVIVNVQKNTVTAEINNDSTNYISADNVSVKAVSNEISSSTPIGAAVAAQNTMAAANVAVNVITNSINSLVKGNLNTSNNIDVTAFDETTLRSRGITVALTGSEALAVLGGTINYDILNKTVNAKIYDSDITANDVNVNATSINSLGGTKNDQGKYDRDNFSDDNYNEKLLAKNDKGEYTGLKQDANFTNWNMFYDVSSGANLAFAGAWIIKNVRNDIEAQVTNSVIGAENLDVTAQDYSVKNIISGAISASAQVGVGASVLITKDNSNVYALITNGTVLDIENALNVSAKNTKDNIQVLAALGGGGTGYAGINVAKNDNTDKTVAKIDKLKMNEPVLPKNPTAEQTAEYNAKKQQWDSAENVTVKAAQTSVNAQSDQNSTHVIVAGGGAGTVALAINPSINTYKSDTTAGILNTTVENSLIKVNANNNTRTRDIQAGVAGSGVVAGVGLVVINDYADTVKAIIDKSVIDTTKDIYVLSNSSLYSLNVLASVGVAIEGVSVVANVVKNHVLTETEAAIKNSTILNAGNIEVLANKDKQDKITNVSGGVSVAATGMSATTGNIYNIYKNKTTADVISTAIDQAASLDVEAYSNKVMTNRNVGVSAGIIGAGLLVDTLDNKLDSTTVALIDAKNKQMFLTDDITVLADDKMQSSNTMVSVYGGAGFAGANINFFESDNLVKAQILSDTEGLISARNVNVNSSSEIALGNTNVGVSLGIGGIAGDVFGLILGKRSDKYSTSEEKSNVNKAKDEAKNLYDKTAQNGANYYTPTTSSDSLKTGTIATSNANILATEDVNINAKSKLKGIDSDKLSLKNVNTSAGIVAVGVGVKAVKLNNNTLAEIAGGNVTAADDVNLNSEFKNNVEIVNTDVNVAGLSVGGSSAMYVNSSDTTSKIENASVSADDINVLSNSDAKADLTGTSVLVSGVSVGISVTEATDTNKTVSLISGDTYIDASGALNINATNNADLSSYLRTTIVSLVAPVTYLKNTAEEKSITKAIIENVNGNINTNGLNIIADSNLMRVQSRTNVVTVTGVSAASIGGAGATMDAELTSGIDSLSGLILNNAGQTQILSGVKHSDNTQASEINAMSQIGSVTSSILGLYTGTEANATNKAKINAKLKANEHNADSLVIKAMQNEANIANLDTKVATLIGVSNSKINSTSNGDLRIDIAGNNTIANAANIYVNNTVRNEVSAFSAVAAIVPGLKMTLKSLIENNTNVNIGGNFNAGTLTADIQTNRKTNFDLTSKAGGIASVNNLSLSNEIKGDSVLTLSDLITDSNKKVNNINLSNVSTNESNTVTSQWSGGLIGDGALSYNVKFDTKTKLNVENSDINSLSDVTLNVKNNTVIADSSETEAAGLIAVSKNTYSQTYNSDAEMNIKNSKINAKNVKLKSTANVSSKGNNHLTFYGVGGGFYAAQKLNITNNIKENSKINIENSQIRAKEKLNIDVLTESSFKQQTSAKASGFIANPKNANTLNVENNNTLNIDANSKLFSGSKVDINLDSNNTLVAHANAKSEHFGFKDPQAESYLSMTINNEINNSGTIEAGDLVDIDFMLNSNNNMTQYAHTESQAAIPTTTEKGKLSQTVKSTFKINSGASVISGNDININYSEGKNRLSSEISYVSVCWAAFGIPITSNGKQSNTTKSRQSSLVLDGTMTAGKGNDKYMKINRDGSVDASTSGFYDSEFTLKNDGIIDKEAMKNNNIEAITIDLQNTNANIIEVTDTIALINQNLNTLQENRNSNQEVIDYINGLQNNNYSFKTVQDVNTIIKNKLKTTITSAGISEGTFDTIFSQYYAAISQIEAHNTEVYESGSGKYLDIPSISDFMNTHDFGLTSAQKTTVINSMKTEHALIKTSDVGNFTIYDNKYILTNEIVTKDNKNIGIEFSNIIDNQKTINEEIENNTTIKNAQIQLKEDLLAKKQTLSENLTKAQNETIDDDANKEYAVVFNYINPSSSKVQLLGIGNYDIKGSGTISVAPSNFKIDNYSQRTIIFNGIDLGASSESGLIILGKNMSAFANKPQAVSGLEAYKYITGITKQFDSLPQNGVHYITSTSGSNGISVTNYHDAENPFIESPIIPDIVFFDDIKSHGIYDIKNTSGDIIFNIDSLIADKINWEALQGNIYLTMENASSKLTLKSGDKIFAGKDIEIKADKVDIKGKLSTGYSDRTLTITDAMLNDLVVDDTTGEKNMINLGNNNIKAVYRDNQIYLYNIGQTGGSITITKKDGSDSTGVIDGDINIVTGHQKITVDNKTSKQLNISNISNDKIVEGLNADGITLNSDISYNGYDSAETTISSVGKLVLDGIINNAKNGEGTLNIIANNGLDINKLVYGTDETVQTSIDSAGNVTIDVKNGDLNIEGNISNKGNLNIIKNSDTSFAISSEIKNQNGDVNINNKSYHKGLGFSGSIENQNGDVIISTFSGLTQTGTITNNNGLIKILNKQNGIASINGNITNNKGDIVLETNGTDINADITAVDGSVSISNAIWKFTISEDSKIQAKTGISIYNGNNNTNKLVINSDILNTGSGEINITNENSDGIEILKDITNKGGNIVISNTGKTLVSEAVTSELGNITIDTNGIDINDEITADKGNILITSTNNYRQNASVTNKEGNTTITVINGTSTINGDITNVKGNISISSDGPSANISSDIKTSNGRIDIENTEGSLTFANTSSITATDGISISNTNDAQNMNILGTVSNTNAGDINISNNSGLATISGAVSNNNGNITISNNGATAISKAVSANIGNISINSNGLTVTDISTNKGLITLTSTNGYSQSGDVINADGNTSVSSTNGSNIIIGDISNTKGNIKITTNSTSSAISSDIKTYDGKIEIENKKGNLTISDTSSVSSTDGIKIKNTGSSLNVNAPVTNSTSGNVEISSTDGLDITNAITNGNGNIIVSNTAGDMSLSGAITNAVGNIQIVNSGDNLNLSGNIENVGQIVITQNGTGFAVIDSLIENTGAVDITNSSNSELAISNSISAQNGNISIISDGDSVISSTIATDLGNISITSDGLSLNNLIAEKAGNITITSTDGYTQNGNIKTDDGKILISAKNGSNSITGDITTEKGNIEIETNSSDTRFESNIKTSDGKIEIDNKQGILEFKGAKDIEATKGILIQNSGNSQELLLNAELTNDTGETEISSKNGLDIKGSIYNKKGDLYVLNENGDLISASKITNLAGNILFANGGGKIDISGDIDNIGDFAVTQKGTGEVNLAGAVNNVGNIDITNKSTSNLSISKAITNEDGNIKISSNGNSIITGAILNDITDGTGNITINSNGLTVGNISTNDGSILLTSTNGFSQSGNIINGNGDTTISSTNGSNVLVGDIKNTKGNISITTNGTETQIGADIKSSDGIVNIENKKGILNFTDNSGVSATNGVSIKNTEDSTSLTVGGSVSNENNDIVISSLKGLTVSNAVTNETGNIIISNASGALDISGAISNETGNITFTNNNGLATISGDIANGNGNVTLTNNDNSIITGAIETLTGDITLTSVGLAVGNISTNDGSILLTSTNGFSQSGNIINGNGDTTISSTNGSNVLVGDIKNTKGNISITTNGTETQIGADIKSSDGIVNIENKKGILNFTDNSTITNKNGDINITATENSGKMSSNGKILANNGKINISSKNGAVINGVIENTNGIINIKNTDKNNLKIGAVIKNAKDTTNITNSSENGGVLITTSGKIRNTNGDINITNNGDKGTDIQGIIVADKSNINITNKNSDIYIGEYDSNNDKYITATTGNIIINQTNGSVYNGTDSYFNGINRKSHFENDKYKTMLVAGGDLEIKVSDGDIGRTNAQNPGVSTKASTRDAGESINVNISGAVTAKSENTNNSDKRLINLRAKESDLNLKNVVSDGNIILTAADMKQTGKPDSSGYAPYDSYSVKNAGEAGDYVISGQNTSIVASNNIGEKGKNLTMIQDHIGNPDSKVYLEAFDSIYFDGRSNKPGEKLQIAQARTKGIGEIVLDMENDTNIEQLVFGHTIKILQKGQNLTINNISMYGEHLEDDESILPTSEDISTFGKQILMEAYDAYSQNGNSTITIKNADILGLGLKDKKGNRIVDVKLIADNIIFESNAKSNLSKEPVVFEVAGVSPDNVSSVGGTRSNYNYKNGKFLANNAQINVETDRANNTGLIFNKLYADKATINTNMTKVAVKDGYIKNTAVITNGNIIASAPNHKILINNTTKGLQPYDAQLYTAKTGAFYLTLDGTNLIMTNAPVVHYDNDILVNGYNSENSFTKLTLKENVVQQVAKSIHEKIMPTDISSLKVQDVKLDTSNIIMDEIINYNISEDKDKSEENNNLSLNN